MHGHRLKIVNSFPMTKWSKSIPKQIVCDILKDKENSVMIHTVQQKEDSDVITYQLLNQSNFLYSRT